MSNGFVHSVKVPRLYKVTARTVQTVEEDGASIKQLIYEKKHPNLPATYALALTTIQNGPKLDQLLRSTKLLFKEPRLDPWLARVLITELLWGKKSLQSEAKPIATVLSYKNELCEALKNLKDDDVVAPISAKVQKPRYVRINTIIKSVEETIESFEEDGWRLLPKSRDYTSFLKVLSKLEESTFVQDFHIPELLAFPPGTQFHDHPGYKSGALVLQDKASCFPAFLLNPSPESTVLDMCAAPGMKTTHLAAIMKNTGTIFAVERDFRRYQTLCELVKTNAADCVQTIHADAMTLDSNKCPGVEYILVDPSCSGSGMLDRVHLGRSDTKCAPGRLISLQSFQVLLLRHALLNFPTAKRVIYSTCSMYPEENEKVVDEILTDIGDSYNLVPITKLLGPNWKNFSSTEYECKDKCLYSKPEVDLSNGFFVAVFERNFNVELPEYKRKIQTPAKRGHGDQGEHGKKKRKKKNKSNGASVNDSETAEKKVKSEEKSQKKKRKRTPEDMESEENVQVKSETNADESSNKKNKKKIKSESELPEDYKPIIKIDSTKGEEVNKKKKKKIKSELELPEDYKQIIKIESTKGEEVKKKKKKHIKSEATEEINEDTDAPPAKEKSKKKKKKKLIET